MRRFNPFPGNGLAPKSLGGAKAGVQAASEKFASGISLVDSIYAPPAIKNFDQSDPRYSGKSDNVENVYLPAADAVKPRSGFAQVVNWLFKGELK